MRGGAFSIRVRFAAFRLAASVESSGLREQLQAAQASQLEAVIYNQELQHQLEGSRVA